MKVKCNYNSMVAVDQLEMHPDNPNTHSDEQIQLYADILHFQGVRKPVIVSSQSGKVVTGHGLIMAAKVNGWDSLPVSYQDFDSVDQEIAHMIADNELGRKSRTDYRIVNELVPTLGPDLKIEHLALENFTIDRSEKSSVPKTKDPNAPAPNPGKGVNTQTISFQCTTEQADIIREAMQKAAEMYPDFSSKARAMTAICQLFLDQKQGK